MSSHPDKLFDVAIVGAGAVGCALARRFARRGHATILIEKGADIVSGASKANSAILHTGCCWPMKRARASPHSPACRSIRVFPPRSSPRSSSICPRRRPRWPAAPRMKLALIVSPRERAEIPVTSMVRGFPPRRCRVSGPCRRAHVRQRSGRADSGCRSAAGISPPRRTPPSRGRAADRPAACR